MTQKEPTNWDALPFEVEGIPELIEYKSWTIWLWTGWKSQKHSATKPMNQCPTCGKQIQAGDVIQWFTSATPAHWTCLYPDNRLATLAAQWGAVKRIDGKKCYIESNCGLGDYKDLPACGYHEGDVMPKPTQDVFIKEDADEQTKEIAKANGYNRLLLLIDSIEG